MSENTQHHYSKKKIFSLVLVPEQDGSKAKTARLSLFQLTFLVTLIIVFFVGLMITLIRTTPLQRFLPVTQQELERRYGKEIYSLRDELQTMHSEFLILQNYNDRLTVALGNGSNKNSNQKIIVDDNSEPINAISGTLTSYNPSVNNNQAKFDFPFSPPVKGYQSNEFSPTELHFGIDFASKRGSVVSAVREGKVIFSDYTERDGNVIILSHVNGFITVYKHNDVLLKKLNQKVLHGESIALLGNTGRTSSGPHLHFELWQNGVPLNPTEFMISSTNIFTEKQ